MPFLMLAGLRHHADLVGAVSSIRHDLRRVAVASAVQNVQVLLVLGAVDRVPLLVSLRLHLRLIVLRELLQEGDVLILLLLLLLLALLRVRLLLRLVRFVKFILGQLKHVLEITKRLLKN